MASLGLTAGEREAVESFRRDVVEPSMTALVIVAFWAEWCGPCKTLGPILEKVAADYAARGVRLVKIDVDKNPLIASQFRVQSIPTVYAIFQGQLVADLTPARTEAQLTRLLDQILQQLPLEAVPAEEAEQEIGPLVAMGEEVLAAGDAGRAASIFTQLIEMAPDDPAVLSGHLRALVALGEQDAAEQALAAVPEELRKNPAIARAAAALALAREAQPVPDLAGLRRFTEQHPEDFDARYRLAGGQMAVGDRDAAADSLLAIIAADRGWNEGAARARLLKLFEVIGLEDPWVTQQRRRLSAVLFT